ncbi:MAG: TRAP transporter small permease [Bacteroidales bacterium]|jgi:TRAP-type C4-dicarboxylate transport system permease small subunit|nr:TRAP transporter small permease [Bacteroidales bacterium]
MGKNKPGTWVDKAADGLGHAGNILAGILFILNVLNIGAAVFSRYILRSSFIWTAELSQLLMVSMVLVAAAVTLKENEHMKIDLLLKYLPSGINKIVSLVRSSIIIIIALWLTLISFKYANSLWMMKTLGLHIPKAIPLFTIPLGIGMFLIMYILLRIAKKPESRSTHEGV